MKTDILTYSNIKYTILRKGYKFFEGDMNLNIVGIRTNNRKVNTFDDYLCLVYTENGDTKCIIFDEFTTDPGYYYMVSKLLNPKGCAIVKPGQYRGVWQLGKHNGKYEALIQTGAPITVYRDRDKDNILDFDPTTEDTGFFGINFHHGYDSTNVNGNSAGCQVFCHDEDLKIALEICKKSMSKYGNKITYTLLEESDFTK